MAATERLIDLIARSERRLDWLRAEMSKVGDRRSRHIAALAEKVGVQEAARLLGRSEQRVYVALRRHRSKGKNQWPRTRDPSTNSQPTGRRPAPSTP